MPTSLPVIGARLTVDTVAITYATPRMMKTIGGDLMVKEIVIGLNGSQYASSLHTVDDEGRVVGHAMYSGELCVKLLQLVESMDTTSNYAFERSVKVLASAPQARRRLSRLRRAGCASRGPLNADVRRAAMRKFLPCSVLATLVVAGRIEGRGGIMARSFDRDLGSIRSRDQRKSNRTLAASHAGAGQRARHYSYRRGTRLHFSLPAGSKLGRKQFTFVGSLRVPQGRDPRRDYVVVIDGGPCSTPSTT